MSDTETKKMICIRCPMGCEMDVSITTSGQITIAGNVCKMGQQYAKDEIQNPSRIVTSTVRVRNGEHPLVPVWTTGSVPKDKVTEIMNILGQIELDAPVRVEQVVVKNILNLGVNIEASGCVESNAVKVNNKYAIIAGS